MRTEQGYDAESKKRLIVALAREIAAWEQGDSGTTRIPRWAVNLATHLIDEGYIVGVFGSEVEGGTITDAEIVAAASVLPCVWGIPDEAHPRGKLCRQEGACLDRARTAVEAARKVERVRDRGE